MFNYLNRIRLRRLYSRYHAWDKLVGVSGFGLNEVQLAFLTLHDIGLSAAYLGMIRAYRGNQVVWETLCSNTNIQCDAKEDISTFLKRIKPANIAALHVWVNKLMSLPESDLKARLTIYSAW